MHVLRVTFTECWSPRLFLGMFNIIILRSKGLETHYFGAFLAEAQEIPSPRSEPLLEERSLLS